MRQSDTRIMKIVMIDKTVDYGSHLSISSDWTEWQNAKVTRRDYSETNFMNASDTWRLDTGAVIMKMRTSEIASITVPADGIVSGVIIGGIIGAAVSVATAVAINSLISNTYKSDLVFGFQLLDVAFLAIDGIIIGGNIGASHSTEYAPDMNTVHSH